jgi:hypothetical protein
MADTYPVWGKDESYDSWEKREREWKEENPKAYEKMRKENLKAKRTYETKLKEPNPFAIKEKNKTGKTGRISNKTEKSVRKYQKIEATRLKDLKKSKLDAKQKRKLAVAKQEEERKEKLEKKVRGEQRKYIEESPHRKSGEETWYTSKGEPRTRNTQDKLDTLRRHLSTRLVGPPTPYGKIMYSKGGQAKKYGYMGGGKVYSQPRKANYTAG